MPPGGGERCQGGSGVAGAGCGDDGAPLLPGPGDGDGLAVNVGGKDLRLIGNRQRVQVFLQQDGDLKVVGGEIS